MQLSAIIETDFFVVEFQHKHFANPLTTSVLELDLGHS